MKQFIKLIAFAMMAITGMSLTSCSNDDDENTIKNISLTCKDTYKIPCSDNVVWTSSNDFIASVSKDNTVTAVCVGEALISSKTGSFYVTVKTINYAFDDPCLRWGVSRSEIRKFMKEVKPDKDTYTQLVYQWGDYKRAFTMYSFEDDSLESVGIAMPTNFVDSENLANHLTDRYVPIQIDKNNNRIYLISPDQRTMILLSVMQLDSKIYYMIVYAPTKEDTRSDIHPTDMLTRLTKTYNFEPANSDATKKEFNKITNLLKR